MDYANLLNERQLEAVSTTSKYTRIIAGAGSGKTRVLTYRISYLIDHFNVNPNSIVAIAFTNKVAEEMKARALSLLHGLGTGLSVSTFHSFCAKFLRKEIDVIGFPNNFTILDDEDTTTLIKNIGQDMGFKKNDDVVKFAINYISGKKCEGLYPAQIFLDRNAPSKYKKALEIFHKYEERKDQMYALDFDDLLLRTIEILEDFDDVREKWQRRITNILVDEFQDVNDIQYKLIKLLMNPDTNLYVVGDPDQTIYTWRGANQQIILDFVKDFPLAETIILDRNYRSTKSILESANNLISHNKKRVPKNLYTENNGGEKVEVQCLRSREMEAKWVIDKIEYLVNSNPKISYRDMAILYRAAYLTLPIENELMRRRIPYNIYGAVKFYQRKEIKDVLAYFRLIYNCKDDVSFERIINVPKRSIGDKTIDILKAEKDAAGLSYYECIQQIENYAESTELKIKTITALSAMISKIEQARKRLDEKLEAYPQILDEFIKDIGYYEYLADDDEGDGRLKNVKTLFDGIIDYMKKNKDSTFDEYLQNCALQSAQDEIKDGNFVTLMTVHVAKGLEYPYIFIVSMSDGIFPSRRTVDESGDDGLEEERRLAYVAMTRAKNKLFITYNNSYSFVLNQNPEPSAFIREAGLKPAFEEVYKTERRHYNSSGFYPDQSYDDFFSSAPKPKPISEAKPKPTTNGISHWEVGDIAIHEVFGRGVVTNIIDDTIIEVEFDQHGKKSILSTHPKVRKESKGGLA